MIFERPGECPPPSGIPNNLWALLSRTDQIDFLQLKNTFSQKNLPILCKDPSASSFNKELESIRMFILSRETGIDQRSIVAGISFGTNGLIAVNIQRLKALFDRSKSSINKGFQLLNYFSVKTKVQEHIRSCIPSIKDYIGEIRKWTIRIATRLPCINSISSPLTFITQTIISKSSQHRSFHSKPKSFEKEQKVDLPISSPLPIIHKEESKFALPQISSQNTASYSFNSPEIRIGGSNVFDIYQCNNWGTKVEPEHTPFDLNLRDNNNENEKSEDFYHNLCDLSINSLDDDQFMVDNYEKHDDPPDDEMFSHGMPRDNGSSLNIK